jgi:hypothetical protein
MILLWRIPLGFVHLRAAVRRCRFVLKRRRDSEANAKRNETPCMSPVDSVHDVTTKFSARVSISCRQLLLKKYVIAPLLPRVAIMKMPAMMQLILKILEHATASKDRFQSQQWISLQMLLSRNHPGIRVYERGLECQSCFVGVEETPAGGSYGRVSALWTCSFSITEGSTAFERVDGRRGRSVQL